ncbi:MAG: hypothetical protein HY791_38100 [Deltaproteobacteria bacterium]|nr:hypothetical protein [Deltaproteobacteria bacterium]
MRSLWMAGALAGTLTTFPAAADELVLAGGEVIEGVVVERDAEVEVRMDSGTITFGRDEVKEIRRTPSLMAELAGKQKKLTPGDVEGLYKLALWAEQSGLGSTARGMFEEVILRKPEHDGARRALGYRKLDGRWVDEEAFMMSKGYVKRSGRFVTPEVAAAEIKAEAEEAERRQKRLDERRLDLMEAQVAEANARAKKAEADAEEAKRKAEIASTRETTAIIPYGYVYPMRPGLAVPAYPYGPSIRFNATLGYGNANVQIGSPIGTASPRRGPRY